MGIGAFGRSAVRGDPVYTPGDQRLLTRLLVVFFAAARTPNQPAFVAWQPSAVKGLAALVFSQALAAWKDYLRVRVIADYADVLPRAFARESAALHGQDDDVPNQSQPTARLPRATDATLSAMSEAIGRLFLSRYMVLDILGTGGMGSVFRAWDPKLERPVAIKTVHMGGNNRASVDVAEQRQVLMREAVTVAKFNHPNIVAIYDVEDAGEAAFLAMEFVDGMSLENYLSKVGTVRVELAVPLIAQIARGLAAAHQAGVIHCDIKPANILLGRDGGVKVTDFGIARSAIRATGNISRTFGTPGYLPPEALVSAAFTPMADLFGVGAVFYELLVGEPPHAGKTAQETLMRTAATPAPSVRESNKSVPPAIDEVIHGLLEKDPARRRPSSARELADTLEAIAGRNGWKWVPPPILADPSKTSESRSDLPTAALPGAAKLG